MVDYNHAISLRAFPYPYKAGLAICSDIDGCDQKTFVKIHRYLNTNEQELALPVADSFFGVGQEDGQMAYFCRDGVTPSSDAAFIRQAIRDGLIDSLHTWGDFNNKPPEPFVLKTVAENLTKDLLKYKLSIKIWINHGDPSNCQNISCRLHPSYQGDNPVSPFYTGNFIQHIGIKYCWRSELLTWPLSGKLTLMSFLSKLAKNSIKNMVKIMLGKRNQIRSAYQMVNLGLTRTLQDGNRIIEFTRFNQQPNGVWTLPTRHTLHNALNRKVFRNLMKQNAYLILYVHLGLPRKTGRRLFPWEDHNALKALAKHYHAGRIWVAPTTVLLNYWLFNQKLNYDISVKNGNIRIDLGSIDDPVSGAYFLEKEELAGICFYTPTPEKTSIRLNGSPLKTVINKPDHTCQSSVSIPLLPPPNTDLLYEMAN